MKRVELETIEETLKSGGGNLQQALAAKKHALASACGGKGLCATCHVHVRQGMDSLTPPTAREARTLSYLVGADAGSRLACQCTQLAVGVVVELPEGVYIERAEDLVALVGKRAETDIRHPITGATLVAKAKIVTRGRLEQLRHLDEEVRRLRATAN